MEALGYGDSPIKCTKLTIQNLLLNMVVDVLWYGAACNQMELINGTMDKFVYNGIFKSNVKQRAQKLGIPTSYMYQQNNDPKHAADLNKMWRMWNVPNQLRTPAQSPDLNPIEHLWTVLKTNVHKHHSSSKQELQTRVREEWENIIP